MRFLFCTSILSLSLCSFAVFAENNCGNNEQAKQLVELIKKDPLQKRAEIRCNKILTDAAVAKAKLMVEYGLVTHNLGGSPNSHLRSVNYELPEHYGKSFGSNQVEAIAGGYEDAEEVWEAFKDSFGHRRHLLGEHEFYVEQDEIGVAFLYDWETPHVEYWVVYLTQGYVKDQIYQGSKENIPNKSTSIMQKSEAK